MIETPPPATAVRAWPPYPAYRDSGVEWLGRIPDHWEHKTIRAITRDVRERDRPDLPLLSVYRAYGVIQKDSRDDNHNRPGEDLAAYKVVQPGRLVLNKMKTWQGSLGVSEYQGIVSPAYITCDLASDLVPRYIHHLLRSSPYICAYNQLSYGVRVDQWDMRYEDFKQLPVNLPPLPEQRAIAAFLDRETARLDALVAKKERLIALLRERRSALISHAVTRGLDPAAPLRDSGVPWLGAIPAHWKVKALKKCIKPGTSISYGIVQPGDNVENGVPFVQTANMTSGDFSVVALQRTSQQIANQYPRSKLEAGDVLLGIRASIGASHVVSSELAGANLSRGVARIVPDEELDPQFLCVLLQSAYVGEYWALAQQGSTFNEVSIATVKELPIILPPPEEQRVIVLATDHHARSEALLTGKLQSQIGQLREYRTALIAAAVTGQIDVRDPLAAPPPAELGE